MLTNLVRDIDDHDLSVLHTRNTQNGLVDVACVNPLPKKISHPAHCARATHLASRDYSSCAIHGQEIRHVNECKFLGIYLDTHLTWKRHIEIISSKISSAIFAINRARDFLSNSVKHALRCLYFALVHSHLTNVIWNTCSVSVCSM